MCLTDWTQYATHAFVFSEKHISLVESIEKFKSFLAGIGVENCTHNGGLECFGVDQAKLITDYFTDRYML